MKRGIFIFLWIFIYKTLSPERSVNLRHTTWSLSFAISVLLMRQYVPNCFIFRWNCKRKFCGRPSGKLDSAFCCGPNKHGTFRLWSKRDILQSTRISYIRFSLSFPLFLSHIVMNISVFLVGHISFNLFALLYFLSTLAKTHRK